MSFWGDVGEGVGLRYTLAVCFILFFLSLFMESWALFVVALALLLGSTWDVWVWWLPGVSRREKLEIRLVGAAERKLRTENRHQWVTQSAAYFRELGFFAREAGLSDDELATKIEEAYTVEWGGEFDATSPHADYLLLKADAERVWWQDTEADVCGENKVYEQVLPEWGRISGGLFTPSDITELWEDEEGPVTVEFTHDRRRHLVEPDYVEDYIDMGVVLQINELIEPSERRFELADTGDQTAFVVCLTSDEKTRLIRDRGWKFR